MKLPAGVVRITGNLSNNIYIVERGDELVVVDPGMPSDYRRLADRIKSLGRSPREVTDILLTHFHVDHAGCAAALKETSGARIHLHAYDVPFLEGTEAMPSVYPAGVQGRALMLFPGTVEKYSRVSPAAVDVAFADGDVLPVLGGLEVVHTPGHTPGSSMFLLPSDEVLFAGDAVQNLYFFLTLPEPGYTRDVGLAASSAKKAMDALAGRRISFLCSGHGPVVRGEVGRKLDRFSRGLRRRGKA